MNTATRERKCRKPATKQYPTPKAETLSREDFNVNQWSTFKTLVLTANKLLLEGLPQDEVLKVLGKLSENRQDSPVLGANNLRSFPTGFVCYA